jgi:hypothetical protein
VAGGWCNLFFAAFDPERQPAVDKPPSQLALSSAPATSYSK